jgi:LuxR family maltose regulon positive regulatory protein
MHSPVEAPARAVGGAPLTKYRVPRVRPDAVGRTPLVERLTRAVDEHPVTLVCAPAGSGKTTLLSQWANATDAALVWITIDADDDDANRLYAALVQAVEPLRLTWDGDPRRVAATVSGTGPQTRAAVAALVNALCTATAGRIVLVLDDLHRIASADAMALIEALVERLPDHVALVIGSRVEPRLPLARWRAYGELMDLGPQELRFDPDDALALATARLGVRPPESLLKAALERTQGWAAGLGMWLQSRHRAPAQSAEADASDAAHRQLFAYLAQEILDELPHDVRDFVLRVSILAELSPEACRIVTDRDDAAALLENLYRRNLFLSALDELTPVLRFHDLFRDFLQAELRRRLPGEVRSLHERAALAPLPPAGVVHHLLRAERWDDAIDRILALGDGLLAQGAIGTIERWIDRIPASLRADHPPLAFLRGTCAWLRWDWPIAGAELTAAVDGLSAPHETPLRVRASFQLVDALSSSGDVAGALARLDDLATLPLDGAARAEWLLHRAWCTMHTGPATEVARLVGEFADRVELDPRFCATTAPQIHTLMVGVKGVTSHLARFAAVAERTYGAEPAPWHVASLALAGWTELWYGRRDAALAILARLDALAPQFASIRLLGERYIQFRTVMRLVLGDTRGAAQTTAAHLQAFRSKELAAHGAAWGRAYLHGNARMYWVGAHLAEWQALLPALTAARGHAEWPYVDVAADLVRGQAAIARGDPAAAIVPLRRALARHDDLRLPQVYADPRIALATAFLHLGDRPAAWDAFEPALREVIDEGAYGVLLLERRTYVDALLDAVPPGAVDRATLADVRRVLADWRVDERVPGANDDGAAASTGASREDVDDDGDAPPSARAPSSAEAPPLPRDAGPLATLTDRELEVLDRLAAGAANKLIAREFDLSLHTVKRHVANILDKLDCASRGEAADLYRRHGGARR